MVAGQVYIGIAISLGIGLLIGAERERRKGAGPTRGSAGIRTFALASLMGGISMAIGGELLVFITTLAVGGLATVAYARSNEKDPGITSELALVATCLLGALAIREPVLSAGLAVVITILLAGRTRIHRFVRDILTEQELHDALLFAAVALIFLPLTPDRPISFFRVLNLRTLLVLTVIFMLISSAGYVAVRTFGSRLGLPLTGLVSGFVSGVATIGSMGVRALKQANLLRSAVAGAVLSTVSTVIQLIVVLWITDVSTLGALWLPLGFAGLAAVAYAAIFMTHSLRQQRTTEGTSGRAFSLASSAAFAATVSSILAVSALMREWFGATGLFVAALVAGFADAHAVAISAGSLVAAGKISAADAVPIILIGFTTNTISKIVIAATTGGRQFAIRVVPGLVLVLGAAWLGSFLRF